MKKFRELFKDEKARVELLFIVISILFGIIISCGKIAGDDVTQYKVMGTTIMDQWKCSVNFYYTWSSRVLVNFIWFVIVAHGKFVWALYMILCMYVLLKGLYLLFFNEYDVKHALFVVGISMLFPMGTLTSAGWVATVTTYFGPQAMGIMALVPIKKIADKKHIGIMEFVLYCLATIYAANTEQMCVVLLFVYGVALIAFFAAKRLDWRIVALFLLNVGSLVFMMTCPGNWGRKTQEIARWFPTYGMLNLIDKTDIGISTTLKWMFADGQAMIIFLCGLLMYFVWKKYENRLYRGVSTIPFVATLFLGPLLPITSMLFPDMAKLAGEVPYYGSFNVESGGIGIGPIQFGFFAMLCVCIIGSLILLNSKVTGLLGDLVLICAGFGSRLMMAFSPTVYASSTRTYTTMVMCLLAVGVHIYSENIQSVTDSKVLSHFNYMEIGFVLFGFLDLISLVATTFY